MNIDFKTAAAYIRVSTDRQTELSPESQLSEIQKFAKANGYIVPKEFVFKDEGISGTKAAKRPSFQQMISIAKQKNPPFTAILVWKFSRFARNQEEAIVYKSMLKKNTVSVISVSEPMDDSPYSSLIERIIEWMDEYYSIRLAGEVKRGLNAKLKKGEPCSLAPFGYYIKDKKLCIDNEKAEIVKDIFQSYISGTSYRRIAIKLNNDGIKTNRGNHWDEYAVKYIICNPAYIGKLRWNTDGHTKYKFDSDTVVNFDGNHEPIISEEIFAQAQKLYNEELQKRRQYIHNNGTVKHQYMLHGLVKCCYCGSTMVYLNGGTRKQSALQCCNYMHAKCSHSQYVTIPTINTSILSTIDKMFETKKFKLNIRSKLPEICDNTKEINRNKQKLKRIKDAYEDGVYTLEEFKQSKFAIEQQIEKLIKEQEASPQFNEEALIQRFIDKNTVLLKSLKDSEMPPEDQNEILRSFVDYITWDKSTSTAEVYFYI